MTISSVMHASIDNFISNFSTVEFQRNGRENGLSAFFPTFLILKKFAKQSKNLELNLLI